MKGAGWLAEILRSQLTGVRIVHGRRGLRVPRAVALTFDDGPSEWTPPILDALLAHSAHGTFFVLGASVAGREAILRRAALEGNELANHAYSHADPASLDDEALRAELEWTNDLIERAAGVRPRLFRPPYADYDSRVAKVAKGAGLSPTVLRSIDPADWRERDPERLAAHVLGHLHPGAIVCLHDALPPAEPTGTADRAATVAALPVILEGLRREGYRAVTVSELLA